ncbi:unnamed protein product [Ilex paraguariensis]|uniref:Deoxyhypusine hydroxylase n=1 Tax=Ilex paraguariensis TaxID=185542 RepID=A0ABC8RVJ7_9AQUA
MSILQLHVDSPLVATRDSSNLLAHEAVFALGQMQDADAIPALELVLKDLSLHPIVHHEAAKAPGAIVESRRQELKNVGEIDGSSPFLSVDPAAPASCSSVHELREVLLNEEKGMYEREVLLNEEKGMYEQYAAFFALRNQGGDEAATAVIQSLGSKSALLKHEHCLVIFANDRCVALLEEFAKGPEPIVSQSCEVALSLLEFERSGKSFEVVQEKQKHVSFVCEHIFSGWMVNHGILYSTSSCRHLNCSKPHAKSFHFSGAPRYSTLLCVPLY